MSQTRTTASPMGAVRLEDLTDSQILALIAKAATDPFAAKALQHLQKQACDGMAEAVQQMLAKLNGIGAAQEKIAPRGPISVLALAGAARQRAAAGKHKREFAEYLVIGALVNRDNPDWDIFAESATAPADAKSGVLALLKMKPPASAAAPS